MGSSGTRRRRPSTRQDREGEDDDDDQDILILVPSLPSLSSGEEEEGGGDFVFAETRTCWDLEVWIQGALFAQNSACPVSQGNTFVTTSIAGKSVTTKKSGPFGSSVVWNERLSLGCHLSSEPLLFQLYAGRNAKSPPCAQWTMDDWLAQAAVNDIPAGGPEEDVQANMLVLPGRVNLMIQLASFVHHDPPPKKGVIALDDISFDSTKAIGGLVGGVLLLIFVVFVSLWCCSFCCCPRTYQERRRRFWAAYGPSTAPAAAATSRPRPPPPPPATRPPPPPSSLPWYSRPTTTTTTSSNSSSSSTGGGGGGGLFSSSHGRPQPYAPSASAPSAYGQSHQQQQQQQQPQVAVAMPVAEAIGPSYREAGGSVPLAEARIMTSFNDGRGGGGGGRGGGRGGGNAGGGGGGRQQDRGRKISV